MSQQIQALRRRKAIMQARGPGGLLVFARLMMPDPTDPGDPEKSLYVIGKPHELMARDLEDVAFDRTSMLVETLPPRHGKSQLVSKMFVAWYIGLYPSREVIVATYNDIFAGDFGADVRNIIESQAYRQVFPNLQLDEKSKNRMTTTDGGKLHFAGRGGSMTGLGAHLLIMDDLIKDAKEANSQTIRNSVWDWMMKVAFTRRMGSKSTIMTWTRWHADDPIGRLTDAQSEHYSERIASKIVYQNYPALCIDEADGTGRKIGEALWPDGPARLDQEYLLDHQALDPMGFESMYQGNPVLSDGALFDRDTIKLYSPEELPQNLRFYAASDHAVSDKQRADSTVLIKAGVDDHGHIWVTDVWWQRAATDKVTEAMLAMGSPPKVENRPVTWWAESGQALKGFLPFLTKRMQETQSYFHITPVIPSGDKVQRAQSISARCALGMVHFPKNASWVERALNEMTAFPAGRHDDFVDALSHLGLGLAKMVNAKGSSERKEKPEPKYLSGAWLAKHIGRDREAANRAPRLTHRTNYA